MVFQKPFRSPLNKSFQVDTLMSELRASISSLNIPVRRATVPPETPGITFAAPMAKPLSATTMFLRIPVMGYIIFPR